MILVDLNQVMISNMMVQIGNHQNAQVDENMIRHMVLNSLRYNRQKFNADFGEFIICCDDKKYWRREFFPFYIGAVIRSHITRQHVVRLVPNPNWIGPQSLTP